MVGDCGDCVGDGGGFGGQPEAAAEEVSGEGEVESGCNGERGIAQDKGERGGMFGSCGSVGGFGEDS